MLLLSTSTAKPNENRKSANVEAQHSFNASDENVNVHFRSKRSFVSDAWVKIKSFVGVETLRLVFLSIFLNVNDAAYLQF